MRAATRLSTVDGKVLAESHGVFANFSGLPEAEARFEFKSAKTDGNVYLPVPTLRTSGAFDDLNRAPAGCRVFPVDERGASGPLGRGRVRVAQSEDGGCGG